MQSSQEPKTLLSTVVETALRHRAWAASIVVLVIVGLFFALASVSAQPEKTGVSITLHFDAQMKLQDVQFGQLQPDIVIVDKGQTQSPTRAVESNGLALEDKASLAKTALYKKDHIKIVWSPSNSGCTTIDGVTYCW